MPGCRSARVEELLADDAAYDRACAALPEWRRRKWAAYRFEADRRLSVAAWLLLKTMLAEAGVAAERLAVVESEFGKPAFLPPCPFYFSLSHTRGRVMAALATSPVGCDVEAPLRVGGDVLRAALADRELAFVRSSPEPMRAFARLWTRKESYLKALGTGLRTDLRALDVLGGAPEPGWELEDFAFPDGARGAICRRRLPPGTPAGPTNEISPFSFDMS